MIREIRHEETALAAGAWHRARLEEYTYLPTFQALRESQAVEVFRAVILPSCEVWVEVEKGEIRGFLALDGSTVDRLYVDPRNSGRVWEPAPSSTPRRSIPEACAFTPSNRTTATGASTKGTDSRPWPPASAHPPNRCPTSNIGGIPRPGFDAWGPADRSRNSP